MWTLVSLDCNITRCVWFGAERECAIVKKKLCLLQEPSEKSPRIAFVLKFYHIHTKYLLIFTYTHPQNALMIFYTRHYTWDFECCISIKTFLKVFVVPKEHSNIPVTVHPTSLRPGQLSARYLPVEYKNSPSLYQIQHKSKLQGSYRYYNETPAISIIFQALFWRFSRITIGPVVKIFYLL